MAGPIGMDWIPNANANVEAKLRAGVASNFQKQIPNTRAKKKSQHINDNPRLVYFNFLSPIVTCVLLKLRQRRIQYNPNMTAKIGER
jgi:hypothetical protein